MIVALIGNTNITLHILKFNDDFPDEQDKNSDCDRLRSARGPGSWRSMRVRKVREGRTETCRKWSFQRAPKQKNRRSSSRNREILW